MEKHSFEIGEYVRFLGGDHRWHYGEVSYLYTDGRRARVLVNGRQKRVPTAGLYRIRRPLNTEA